MVGVGGGREGFSTGFDGGEGLSDCVGYATEDLGEDGVSDLGGQSGISAYGIGYHCCKDWLFCIVGIEFGY